MEQRDSHGAELAMWLALDHNLGSRTSKKPWLVALELLKIILCSSDIHCPSTLLLPSPGGEKRGATGQLEGTKSWPRTETAEEIRVLCFLVQGRVSGRAGCHLLSGVVGLLASSSFDVTAAPSHARTGASLS